MCVNMKLIELQRCDALLTAASWKGSGNQSDDVMTLPMYNVGNSYFRFGIE
jgi:hypothetical protein